MPEPSVQNVYPSEYTAAPIPPGNPSVPPFASPKPGEGGSAPVPPAPKRAFPMWILYVVGGLVLVLVLVLVGRTLFTKVSGQKTEITWWGLWEDDSIISPLISEYQQSHPEVTIKYIHQSKQDYRERLTNAIAKGTAPDIFRFHNSWVPMFKRDLDPIPSSVMSAADFTKTFYPVASSDLSNGTSLVGVPLEYDGLTLYINEDLFATAGLNPPATWDDLRTTACQLTTTTNGTITQAGVALGTTGNVDHWPEILGLMMLQNGVDLAKPTGKPAEDALSFYTVFSSDKACAGSGASSAKVWDSTLPASTTAFAAGKLAMYFGPSWRAFEIKQQNPSLKFRAAPLPQLPKISPSDRNLNYASYWAEGVWAKSKKKTAAWEFLKFLSTKESLEKFYANASKLRTFGEPYPRVDMASLVKTDPLVGPLISGASDADSWYLQSRTWDGPTGINSQIDKYFEDAINAVNSGNTTPGKALETVSSGVSQVLSQYGLIGQSQ